MIQNVLKLIQEKKIQEARLYLTEINTVDLAESLAQLDQQDLVRIFRMLPKDSAAEVFSYLSRDLQKRIIFSITDQEIASIMDDLFLDDAVDMIDEMPANVVKRVLMNTDPKTRSLINHFLQYPDGSAGSIMTIEFVDLKKSMTVRESFDHIRRTGVDKETIYTCYVTDQTRKLEGIVSVRTLLFSQPEELIEDIMDTQFISVQTLDDQEQIVRIINHYDLLTIPVVDNEQRLVGIITVDDAMDVIQSESTEDFEKMAALLPSDLPYLETGNLVLAKRRIPWLLFLMVSAVFSGAIITFFEDTLAIMPALVAMIPMLMATGGNSGSQAATLIIRGLALDQITTSDISRIVWKETRIALLLGTVLAVVNVIRVILFNHSVALAVIIGLSMIATVFIAKLIGAILPLGAYKMKLDPAIMAAPVITTLVDAGSLIAFFLFANLVLNM